MNSKRWSQQDISYMKNYWGEKSIEEIANDLHRTAAAVKLKANRLGLKSRILYMDGITIPQLTPLLNVHYKTIKQWITHYGLPSNRKQVGEKRSVWIISLDSFWKWAEKHKHKVDFSQVEEHSLGAEPLWVKEKRKIDQASLHQLSYQRWTKKEDHLLQQLIEKQQYTYPDLVRIFKRSELAIQRRLHELEIKGRPLWMEGSIWADEDVEKAISLLEQGWPIDTVAHQVGKTEKSLRSKLEREGIYLLQEAPKKEQKAVGR